MTEREYRAHPAISRSELFKLMETPEKFKFYRENPEPPTAAMLFGQLFHATVLQPETVDELFVIAPEIDRRTKAGRDEYAEFLARSEGKTAVPLEMVEQANAMRDVLMENELARKLLGGEKEISYFWMDELTGEECKCRADVRTEIGNTSVIVDLKTTDNAETDTFMRSALKYGYDLQAGMYTEGVEKNTGKKHQFVFIAIEKKPPYAVNIMLADKLFVDRGRNVFRRLMGIYHDCKQSGNWYGYLGKSNTINNLTLPVWAAKQEV